MVPADRQPDVRISRRDSSGDDHERRRPTYPQDWPNYKLAREYEQEFFFLLVSDLMDLVLEPSYSFGRPRHKFSDVLKAMALKVWGTKSMQRTKGYIREAHRLGYIEKVPGSNTVIDYFGLPDLTPILHECIEFTASVLRPYESDYAIDSSGFRTTQYMRWVEEKWGRESNTEDSELVERKSREWLKVHIVVGTNTHIIVGARVEGWRSSDSGQFIPLFQRVTKLFDVKHISADMAYTGRENFDAAESWGATLFTPFHNRHVRPPAFDQSAWAGAYRMFADNFDEWFPTYHRRSLSETAFSTVKRLLSETIRSKTPIAQINEMLLKVLAHNIIVLIRAIFVMDLHPFFASADWRLLNSIPEEHRPLFMRDGIGPARQWQVDSHQFRHVRTEPLPHTGGIPHGSMFGWPHHMPQSDW